MFCIFDQINAPDRKDLLKQQQKSNLTDPNLLNSSVYKNIILNIILINPLCQMVLFET